MASYKLHLGKIAYTARTKRNAVTLELTLEDQINHTERYRDWVTLEPVCQFTRVAISGNIWNATGTDIVVGGQCIEEIAELISTPELRRIEQLWKEWHLNDMKSGTAIQAAYIKGYLDASQNSELTMKGFRMDHYGMSCHILKKAGLYEDRGYKYGHSWLVKPVPSKVIDELKALFGVKPVVDGLARDDAEQRMHAGFQPC